MATYKYTESGAPSLKVFQWLCDDCDHSWDTIQLATDPPPDGCPKCEERAVNGPVPTAPAIGGSNLARASDKLYRDMETTSAARAEAANDPSLKITNLKDNFHGGGTRAGDIVAPAVNNAVTQFVDSTGMSQWSGAGGGATGPGGVSVGDLVTASKHGQGVHAGKQGLAAIQSKRSGSFNGVPPRK